MKKVFIFFITFLFFYSTSFARIMRVGYNGIPVIGVDYTSFLLAYNAVIAGDTVQVYGSQSILLAHITISKKMVIQGFGYNFDANVNLQAIGLDAPSLFTAGNTSSNGSLIFDLGSENSVIEGVVFDGQTHIDIATSDITVRRCNAIVILRNDLRQINNAKIESCVAMVNMYSSTSSNPCVNTQIRNCILRSVNFYLATSIGIIINCATSALSSPSISLSTAAFLVKNSLFYNYNPGNVNTVWENNFFNTPQPQVLPTGANNRWGQSWADLYQRLGGALDNPGLFSDPTFAENYYLLKPGSLAIDGGFDSNNNPTDCGIFGGDIAFRYKLGGVPAVPAVYKLTAPSSSAKTNPFNITISVRSNN